MDTSSFEVVTLRFITALEYILIFFIFYISNSIRVNCSIGREGWSEWKVHLVAALVNSLGWCSSC